MGQTRQTGEVRADGAFRTRLIAVVACAAVLRALRLVVSKWDQPLGFNDSLYYSAQARQLAHGVWFREAFADQPGAEHGPLTSTLMAVVSWGNDPINRQRMVTVVCGIATVAIIGIVARRVAGNRAGLIAAGVAAVYPNLWLNDGLVMSESVSCLLISLALWALLTWSDNPTLGAAVLVGIAVGLGTLARSELVLFAPGAAVLMWLIGRRSGPKPWTHIATATGVAMVMLAPWVVFNVARFDRPVLLTTNEGPSLLVPTATRPTTDLHRVAGRCSVSSMTRSHDRTRIPRPGQRGNAARGSAMRAITSAGSRSSPSSASGARSISSPSATSCTKMSARIASVGHRGPVSARSGHWHRWPRSVRPTRGVGIARYC